MERLDLFNDIKNLISKYEEVGIRFSNEGIKFVTIDGAKNHLKAKEIYDFIPIYAEVIDIGEDFHFWMDFISNYEEKIYIIYFDRTIRYIQ